MPRPKHHVFVCGNRRPPGHPKGCCQDRGAAPLMQQLQFEVERAGLYGQVAVTATGCLGPCDRGPTMVVYPDGAWYGQVKTDDVAEIVESHLSGGTAVERLLIPEGLL